MLETTNNLENLNDINVQALKRSFNIISRKQILNEDNIMTQTDKEQIIKYPNQTELWSLYKLSVNNFSSFREMILGI